MAEQATKPTRIDYRSSGWGHTISLKRTAVTHESGEPIFAGYLFSGIKKPKVGTEVVVPMGSGRPAVFELTEVRWCQDPTDMYFVKARPMHYLDEERAEKKETDHG